MCANMSWAVVLPAKGLKELQVFPGRVEGAGASEVGFGDQHGQPAAEPLP